MMQSGIFTAYFPYTLEETAKKIRSLDFNTVQLDMHFKDIDLSPGQITRSAITTRSARMKTETPLNTPESETWSAATPRSPCSR